MTYICESTMDWYFFEYQFA